MQAEADQRAARFAGRARQVNDRRAGRGQAPLQVRPRPRDEAPQPNKTTNLTDPDSRILLGRAGWVQGYNAQAVATAEQIIVGAEIVAVARHGRRGKPRADGKPNTGRSLTLAAAMAERLESEQGQDLMRQRRTTIEPLFGQIKHRLGPSRQFSRRGLQAASDEWKLICASSNLLKLWRLTTA